MTAGEVLGILRAVDFLAPLDDDTLAELVDSSRTARRAKGDRIVSELESGADVFVITRGTAEVVVEPRRGERKVLRTLAAGCAFGEMSSLTGNLRSATVMATSEVELLVIDDETFDRLRERRPAVALSLLRTLSQRLADADRSIDELLTRAPARRAPSRATPTPRPVRSGVRGARSSSSAGAISRSSRSCRSR